MIDMLGLLQIAANLGGRAPASDRYDELVTNTAHKSREAMRLAPAFGVKVSSSHHVPPGFIVMRFQGKVIGALDVADKRTMFIHNPTEWFEISEKSK